MKMKTKVAKSAAPAAIAVLRQATARQPRRKKASDGLLPSAAHLKASPTSDHNTGYAVDLTHDLKHGIDCAELFEKLQEDKRVKYLIFRGRIWSEEKGVSEYSGLNAHNKHIHISIKDGHGNDTSEWFPWWRKAKPLGKIVSKVQPLRKKRRK